MKYDEYNLGRKRPVLAVDMKKQQAEWAGELRFSTVSGSEKRSCLLETLRFYTQGLF